MDHCGIDEIRRASIRLRMDIDVNRLDWTHLRSFLATAETTSLSGAARQLGLTQPTLSRQVAALESSLSVLLFERVGRGLELTDAGRELLAHVQDMGVACRAHGRGAAIRHHRHNPHYGGRHHGGDLPAPNRAGHP